MKFFYADSQDQSNLNYDCIQESHHKNTKKFRKRLPQIDDQYFHEMYGTVHADPGGEYRAPKSGYHGLLVSLTRHDQKYARQSHKRLPDLFRFPSVPRLTAMAQPHTTSDVLLSEREVIQKLKKVRSRIYKVHRELPIMMDSGAFDYKNDYEPPFTTSEVMAKYHRLQCQYGVALDHMTNHGEIVRAHSKQKIRKREEIKLRKSIHNINVQIEGLQSNQMLLGLDILEDLYPLQGELRTIESQLQTNLREQSSYSSQIEYLEQERTRRFELSIQNAVDFIELYTQHNNFGFKPVATVQGWDVESYTESAKRLAELNYPLIAVGGLVPIASNTDELRRRVEAVSNVFNREKSLHLFGIKTVSKADIDFFHKLGVYSFDTSSPVFQSFQDQYNNYWTNNHNYISLRVPQVGGSNKINAPIKKGDVTQREAEQQEATCLQRLRALNHNSTSHQLDDAFKALEDYALMWGETIKGRKRNEMKRTLKDRPWLSCPCKACKHFGVEIILFRGSVRNKARGFHNIWQVGEWVRKGGYQ